jgi:hypothetical protein
MYPDPTPRGPSSPIGARKGAYQTLDQRPTGMMQRVKDAPRNVRRSAGNAITAARTPSGRGGYNAGILREGLNRGGQVWRSGAAGKAGLIGAGLAAAGAVGAGGYALKKRADRKAQERGSIKGRVKRLLGR